MGMHGRSDGYCINLVVLKHLVNVLSTADAWIQGSNLFTTISLKVAARDEQDLLRHADRGTVDERGRVHTEQLGADVQHNVAIPPGELVHEPFHDRRRDAGS